MNIDQVPLFLSLANSSFKNMKYDFESRSSIF